MRCWNGCLLVCSCESITSLSASNSRRSLPMFPLDQPKTPTQQESVRNAPKLAAKTILSPGVQQHTPQPPCPVDTKMPVQGITMCHFTSIRLNVRLKLKPPFLLLSRAQISFHCVFFKTTPVSLPATCKLFCV